MSGRAATTRAHGGPAIVFTVVIGSAAVLAWRPGIWDLLRPGPSCRAGSARLVASRQDHSGGETLQMTGSG